MIVELTGRSVLAVSGEEARPFLQGLVTADLAALKPERPLYAALLTPQGKILFDFLLSEACGTILLDGPAPRREGLARRLSLYKLRAKVEIAPRDDLGVYLGEGPPDPRLAALGPRLVRPKIAAAPGDDAYLLSRLELGVPEGGDFGSGRLFALEAGLAELHGVSFTKGCYVGQEQTARMKHRGKDAKRLLPLVAEGPLPGGEVPVTAGGADIGTLLAAYGNRGFALLRLDRLQEAPLEVAGMKVAVPDRLFS